MDRGRRSSINHSVGGGPTQGRAFAASFDASVIVGEACTPQSGCPYFFEAFRWGAGAGAVSLGDLQGYTDSSRATAVNADGSVVVGYGWMAHGHADAFIWDYEHSMRRLADVLIGDYGLDLGGWILVSATGISADGRTIVGNGINSGGDYEPWIAHLGPPVPLCPADFNASGAVNSQDFFDYLNAFFTSDPRADFNHSGQINTADFFDFLAAFFAGCG